MKTRYFLSLLFLSFGALTGAPQARAANICDAILVDTAPTIFVNYESPTDVKKTINQTLQTLAEHMVERQNVNIELYQTIEKEFAIFEKAFIRWVEVVYSSRLGMERFTLHQNATRWFSESVELYEKTSSGSFYINNVSPVQRFYSLAMTSYAAISMRHPQNAPLRMIDFGAGTGDSTVPLLQLFPNAVIFATDRAEPMLSKTVGLNDRLIPVEHDFRNKFPFPDNSFDFVQSITAAGQYLSAREFNTFMRRVHRLLKPGGFVMLEFGPHTSDAMGNNFENFLQKMSKLGFTYELKLNMQFLRKRHRIYPVLLRKPER